MHASGEESPAFEADILRDPPAPVAVIEAIEKLSRALGIQFGLLEITITDWRLVNLKATKSLKPREVREAVSRHRCPD